ncbi:hypothetical protein [Mycolicibacterium goodii]|uniref:hypothetical protein n=1 Tax=Mycolicibacterium goodii TaxID=134601 RepID=UPI0013043239|nr:hypothetical protein [Mycolicibacterium goodii]
MNTPNPHGWWWDLPQEQRDKMDAIARRSILRLDCYPYGNAEVAAELLAWVNLEAEVAEMHVEWLTRTRRKFERRGVPWTTENLERYSRLWEVE